ncbi:OsmC-like protein [Ostertagia ostertagi]
MRISATINNGNNRNEITVKTGDSEKVLHIPAKPGGSGSSVNGGEFLFLSLATCFCNDIYREAAKRNITVASVEVNVNGEFGGEGEPAISISYDTKIDSPGSSREELEALVAHVDRIAEIHGTLRAGIPVTLKGVNLKTQ